LRGLTADSAAYASRYTGRAEPNELGNDQEHEYDERQFEICFGKHRADSRPRRPVAGFTGFGWMRAPRQGEPGKLNHLREIFGFSSDLSIVPSGNPPRGGTKARQPWPEL
jgi:hypothetical protein